MNPNVRPDAAFADRCFRISRIIHWVTVALVSGLLITALSGHIDPHGAGNAAFLWHSSLGISVYLLSISRVLLWFVYRPAAMSGTADRDGQGIDRTLRIAFYAILVTLPISGWILASEEGMHTPLFGIPALPQWYHQGAVQHTNAMTDTSLVVAFSRIHAWLAAALFIVVIAHLFTVIRRRVHRSS
jgi:cytochrome b561